MPGSAEVVQGSLEFTPAGFVAILNQTLEYAYSQVVIVGELSGFRVAREKWVYFDLKDSEARVSFFGNVWSLPGPLEDGMVVRVSATPRLHPQFGFTLNFTRLEVAGEGSLKKASDLLYKKLELEGIFNDDRKRPIPEYPETVGLITAKGSAAESDFRKVSLIRWPSLKIQHKDAIVQGSESVESIIQALSAINQLASVEVIVITRGGGGIEDLAAFNDERVVRAIASSRIPTVVAIGHEKDFSLAELAADARSSTPTDAAMLVTADASHEAAVIGHLNASIIKSMNSIFDLHYSNQRTLEESLYSHFASLIESEKANLGLRVQLIDGFDPLKPLKNGYAIVSAAGRRIVSINNVRANDILDVRLADGTISAKVEGISK